MSCFYMFYIIIISYLPYYSNDNTTIVWHNIELHTFIMALHLYYGYNTLTYIYYYSYYSIIPHLGAQLLELARRGAGASLKG